MPFTQNRGHICLPAGGEPRPEHPQVLADLMNLVYRILDRRLLMFSPHREALAACLDTQSAVVDLLLEQALPYLEAAAEGAGMDWYSGIARRALDILAHSLDAASLQPAMGRRLRQPSGAAFMQLAVRVVEAVPESHGAREPADKFVTAHANSARLLYAVCIALMGDKAADPAGSSQDSTGSAGTAGDRGRHFASSAEWQAAAWEVAGLVPHMASAVVAVSAISSASQAMLAYTCSAYSHVLSRLVECHGISSQQRLEVWAAAADAGLRLLPLLRQLDVKWQQQDVPARLRGAAQDLISSLMHVWIEGCYGALDWANMFASTVAADVRASLAGELEQLHSRSCRLLQWLAAADNRAALPGEGSVEDWRILQRSVSILLSTVAVLEQPQGGQSGQHEAARWATCALSHSCINPPGKCMWAVVPAAPAWNIQRFVVSHLLSPLMGLSTCIRLVCFPAAVVLAAACRPWPLHIGKLCRQQRTQLVAPCHSRAAAFSPKHAAKR